MTIRDYSGKKDLKDKIVNQYIMDLQEEIETHEGILGDKDWASSGDKYHLEVRKDMEQELIFLKKQYKLLKQ